MFRFFFMFSFLFISTILVQIESKLFPLAVRLPLNGTPAELGASLWPKPVSHQLTSSVSFIHRDFFNIKYHLSLNECEQEILKKLWSTNYKHVLFSPKLSYEYPSKSEAQMNLVVLWLLSNENTVFGDLIKKIYNI